MHKYLKYWKDNYTKPGMPDKRAVEDFIECETSEIIKLFRLELQSVLQGNYTVESLDVLIGPGRVARHGSYEDWAKLMLQWIAAYLKQ